MIGLVLILLAHLVAFLGYIIMPDSTPDANDGAVEIKRQGPGFEVTVVKVMNNPENQAGGFFSRMIYGAPSPYKIYPVSDWHLEGQDTVVLTVFNQYGNDPHEERLGLLGVVRSVYYGESKALSPDGQKVKERDGVIQYVNNDEEVVTVTRAELVEEFKENNVEERSYWLGTESGGRDILSMLIYGTRISLSIGFVSVLISLAVGVTLGALAGFFGGVVDSVIMWFMTVIWSIPAIVLVIAISMALQSKGIWVAFVAVGLTMWVEVARVVRGQIMALREKQYVEAARAMGFGSMRIIFKHILPNVIGPMIVIATANFAAAILIEAGLSFLGLGVKPPTPSWGAMVYEGWQLMSNLDNWHILVFPSICISLLVLAFNLLGNGLRDAFDPKTNREIEA